MAVDLARADISKKLVGIKTIGAGSSEEGTAYLILQMFDVAKRRLSNKEAMKLVYLENPKAPEGLRNIAERYVNGKIDQPNAEKEIDEMKQTYEKVLSEEYGLRGSNPSAIFFR
jgi:hypothetical protein